MTLYCEFGPYFHIGLSQFCHDIYKCAAETYHQRTYSHILIVSADCSDKGVVVTNKHNYKCK